MGKTRRYDNGGVRKPKFKRHKKKKTFTETQEGSDLDYKNLVKAEKKFYEDNPWNDIFEEDNYDADRYYK